MRIRDIFLYTLQHYVTGKIPVAVAVLYTIAFFGALFLFSPKSEAANFSMQTGYYMGSGVAGLAISGLGFQPDFVMIKSSTAAGAAVFKTSAMPANTIAFMSAAANNTGTNITFTSDGFTVGTLANVNTANILYYWIAFTGSDCSATGNYCVGTYTGNGVNPRNITVGFQPDLAIVKQTTAVDANFRVSSQPVNETLFMDNSARDTVGNYIRTFTATQFTIGATNNTNLAVYYYVAFKTTASAMSVGTFTGNNTDNRSITGLGYQPDFVLAKNATSATANNRRPLMNFTESFGDSSSYVGDATADIVNGIQNLESDGFQIGTSAQINENATTLYYFAFAGAAAHTTSNSFSMATGSYTGTGASNNITGLSFRPDLVIVKASNANAGVFRTKMMNGDSTSYLDSATANLTGAITTINNDGFTVGTAAQTNSLGIVYYWQAFGNAYDPYDHDGANDFAIGAYYGNGIDSRNITRMPWQADMVSVKRNGATAGTWRSSETAGDSSSFFGATAESANFVQALQTDGFQIGTNAGVNTAANVYYWFAFKEGSNFAVGSYTGTGTALNVTSAGMRSEYVWVKRSTAVNGVQKSVRLSGDNTQYFVATANATNRITGHVKGGFSVGTTTTEANTSGGTYRYATWNDTSYGTLSTDIVDASGASVASPSFAFSTLPYSFECMSIGGTVATSSQRIRVSNLTTTPGWSLSIAATSGATDVWENAGLSESYDFNETAGSPLGCSDGADSDTDAGTLSIDASTATISPETGCSSSNLTLSSLESFAQGTQDSIELLNANNSADADCIWDITGLSVSQRVPAEQPIDNYSINLTITVVAN